MASGVIEDLVEEAHNINSPATIIRSVQCQVDLDKLLGCQAYGTNVSRTLLRIFFSFFFFVIDIIFKICLFILISI